MLAATFVGDLSKLDADFLAVSSRAVDRGFVRAARARHKDVYAWTVNDPVQMFRLAGLGVDGLITDEPALARRVLEKRRELSTVERLVVGLSFYFGAAAPDPAPAGDLG